MELDEFDPSQLKYNEAGLIPCIVQDVTNNEVLMMAWMNAESLRSTLDTKKMTYWSRSRQEFWIKGETSGNTQELVSIFYDCDQDTLLAFINQKGPACHTGRRSCFYTEIKNEKPN